LGEIASGFDYGMNSAAKSYDGKNKYIRITDIDASSASYSNNYIVSPDGKLQNNYLVNKNDILLARTGASTGKSYLYESNDGRLYFAGFLIRINIPKENPYFIFTQFHTSNYKKWVSIMSARSGQPGINSQEYSSYLIYVTGKQEQDKISSLLSLLDERIAAQNKIIEDLKKLKSAMIDLFFHGNMTWQRCCIGDILKIGNGKDYKHLNSGNIPVYGTGGRMLSVSDWLYDGDSVCIGRKGTINQPMFLSGKFWTVDTLFYTYDFKNITPKFCYYLFNTINWLEYNEASGVPSLSKATIEKIKVKIPNMDKQIYICSVLDSVCNKIKFETKIVSNYNSQKSYLLQQMFI